MANIKSAKKRAVQAEKRRLHNLARRSDVKTAIKKFILSVDEKQDVSKARELLNEVTAKLSRAKSKGIIHANTAARKLSRLRKQFNKTFEQKEVSK